jgi:phosphoribosyl-AMP cyclohydrolase
VFWSRSRQEVWRKGDTSGDRQFVREAFYDCDGDTLLFVVEQEGKGACHTGRVLVLLPVVRRAGDP